MAAPRRSRAGVGAGALALAVLGVLVAYPAAGTGRAAPFVVLPGLLGAGLLAAGFVFRIPEFVPWALAPVLGEYATFLLLEGEDRFAPAFAAGLVLLAELAYWALEPRHVGRARSIAVRRAVTLLGLAGGSGIVAALLLGASELAPGGGLALAALGAAAAVLSVAVVVWLARATPAR
jgi:hypothetical protein